MRATKHAPRGPFYLLERRNGLTEIVERGGIVVVKRLRVSSTPTRARTAPCRDSLARTGYMTTTASTSLVSH